MTGIAAVQARMAELRALVDPAAAAADAATTTATTTAAAAASSGTDFASALALLTGSSTAGTLDESASIAPGSGVTGQDLVAAAEKYVGVPYVWGGESLDEGGLDCSGLVMRSLADLGITSGVPRVASDQMKLGQEVSSLDQALPGDLLVFGGGTHIGIYVGDGKMIDAPRPGKSVSVRDVYTEPTTIRRILPQETSATSAAGSLTSSDLTSLLASATSGRSALSLLSGTTSGTGSSSTASTSVSALSALLAAGVAS